jgi:hypothetical protein
LSDHDRIGELFDQLKDRTPEEREKSLAKCSDPDHIKAEVRSLLAAHDRAGQFLEKAVTADSHDSDNARPNRLGAVELTPGQIVGHYQINGIAGRGGMGVVYDAWDTRLQRRVALKALPSAFDGDETARRRLKKEAVAPAGLQHPGIATVYALEEINGGLFIATEFLEGQTLREEMNRELLGIERAVAAAADIARALCAAHEQRVVHRDLKPENIIRTRTGILKIVDFGLAQFEEAAAHALMSGTRITQKGRVVGTLAYMAPEQLRENPTDFRVDLFALGIVLYELCVGKHPFGGGSPWSTMVRIVSEPPDRPAIPDQLPLAVWLIVERCLQKDPAERYPSTRELVAALEQVQEVQRVPTPHAAPASAASETAPDESAPPSAPPAPIAPVAPLTALAPALLWWRVHQITATVAYSMAMWPVWHVHRSLGRTGLAWFFIILAAVVVAGLLRLHLAFSSGVYPEDLPALRAKDSRGILVADIAYASLLIIGGIALAEQQPGWSAVLIAVGIGSAIAFVFIEPATARAAFRDRDKSS